MIQVEYYEKNTEAISVPALKVLFLIDNLYRGGKERRMIELLKGLIRHGAYAPEVAIMSDNIEYQELFELGIPVHTLVRRIKKDPFQFFRLYRLCRQIRPDLIHSWGAMSSIYAIPVAKMFGIKLINGCIADAPAKFDLTNKKHLWTKLAFPFSDVIIGNSQAGLDIYGAPMVRSKRIYNGFDFNRIRDLEAPETVRERFRIPPGPVVGMVGAFYDRKDYHTFIRAAVSLLDVGKDITFLAIGDGPNLERCRELVPVKYRSRILLPGLIQRVESVIQLFDVGVLSTNARVHGEGVSNAIVEYMVMGKPVVATRGGGTAEILVHKKTGYLVPPEDPLMMANRIGRLIAHPDEARKMGKKGKKRVKKHFSLDHMTQQYLELYQELAP